MKTIRIKEFELLWTSVEHEVQVSNEDYKEFKEGKITIDELVEDTDLGDIVSERDFCGDPFEISYEFIEEVV